MTPPSALQNLKIQLENQPNTIEFADIIELIHQLYDYTPTRFTNGNGSNAVISMSGSNEGSCKIFAFAKLQEFSKEETLMCFGAYYRNDVLKNPEASDHANIRSFMQYGWGGISFDEQPLTLKN
jgi:hypothetical protein